MKTRILRIVCYGIVCVNVFIKVRAKAWWLLQGARFKVPGADECRNPEPGTVLFDQEGKLIKIL